MNTCTIDGCVSPLLARRMCTKHYKRWKRRGSVHDLTSEHYFFARVTESDAGCWLWDKPLPEGYGTFSVNDHLVLAHRWSYEFLRTEIPEGLVLDHECRTPSCVNPWHLEPVTQRANVMRSDGITALNARKTACLNGHPFDAANTYLRKDRPGHRACRTCAANRDHARNKSRRLVGASQGG